MRQSKFTETQIVSILKGDGAGRPVNEIWRSYSTSYATYYKWKAKYGGLEASDIKRLKELEPENSKLKGLYADMARTAPEIRTVWEVVAWLHQRHRGVANQRSEAMKQTRRNHGASCKAPVALAAVKGDKTRAELAEPFSAPHPDHQMEAPVTGASRRHVLWDEGSIGDAGSQDASRENRATGAGERFVRGGAQQDRRAECNAMIDRTHPLPVVRQCQRFGVARSTASYQPTPMTDPELALRRRIDELHLPYPFAGARMLRFLLQQNGQGIGRRRGPASCGTWGSPSCIANPPSLSGILPIDSTPISCAG